MGRIVIFDVDGTLVDGRVWKGILKHPDVSRWAVRWLYASTLPLLFLLRMRFISETYFRDQWVRGLARLLAGWSQARLDGLAAWISQEFLSDMYRTDIVSCLRSHKTSGDTVILVSTMLDVILAGIGRHLGADACVGTTLELEQGRATGDISGESCVGPRKADFANAYMRRYYPEHPLSMATAYADSMSDIPLLEAVAQSVVVYPDARLRAEAEARGWPVLDATKDVSC